MLDAVGPVYDTMHIRQKSARLSLSDPIDHLGLTRSGINLVSSFSQTSKWPDTYLGVHSIINQLYVIVGVSDFNLHMFINNE